VLWAMHAETWAMKVLRAARISMPACTAVGRDCYGGSTGACHVLHGLTATVLVASGNMGTYQLPCVVRNNPNNTASADVVCGRAYGDMLMAGCTGRAHSVCRSCHVHLNGKARLHSEKHSFDYVHVTCQLYLQIACIVAERVLQLNNHPLEQVFRITA
jgi:hypothetical protein